MGSNRVATHEGHWSELLKDESKKEKKDESNGKTRSLKVKKRSQEENP